MNSTRTALLAAAVGMLCGCASIKAGDKDTEARLKRLEPTPGAVSLYVCREKALLFAAGVRTAVWVDNKPIGTLKPNMFAHVLVTPGKHGIFLKRDGLYGGSSGVHEIDAKAGEVVFVWAGMTGGGFGTLTVDDFDSPRDGPECVKGAEYSITAD
jgi:hypothetical protein